MKKTFFFVILFIFFGIFIRSYLSPVINKGDVVIHYEWGKVLYEKGLSGSYLRPGWTYSFPTQPPLMMMLFTTSHWFNENRYYLSLAHNITRFPPTAIIKWFDRNGEFFFFRFWAIMADVIGSILVYFLLKKLFNDSKIAIGGLIFLMINPISIFISGIWGQNDLVAALLALISFYLIKTGSGRMFSPLLFAGGILIKPTVMILLPLYFFVVLNDFVNIPVNQRKKFIISFILGIIAALTVSLFLFYPFMDNSRSFWNYLRDIIVIRIIPSAKGVSRASVSAFNIYSLFFIIDRTLGTAKIAFINLDQIGLLLCGLIYSFSLYFWRRNYRRIPEVILLNFIIFIIVEGFFLFKTDMLERYFLLTLLPVIILIFLKLPGLRIALLIQNIVWLLNLIYSFFRRDSRLITVLFENNNYAIIRLLSFLNIVIFLYIIYRFWHEAEKGKYFKKWNYR